MRNRILPLICIFLLGGLLFCNPAKGINPDGLQSRGGLPAFFAKIREKQDVTVVFLGGSITNHRGYRVQITEWMERNYPEIKIHAVNVGIGGTGSDLGVFRTDEDVLLHDPDLVFVEFAVNDSKTDSLLICNSMEGIVRKIKQQDPATDICFLYTLNIGMLDDLKAGKTYRSVRFMENVAGHYGIPSVNFAYDVMDLLNKDQLVFKGEKDKSYPGKVVFTNDGTHPTFDGGHVIYTRTLAAALTELGKQQAGSAAFRMPAPLYPTHYEQAKMYSVDEFVRTGGWQPVTKDDKVYQYFQGDSGKLPVLLSSADPEDSIVVRFKGIRAGLFDVIGPSSGGISVQTDGEGSQYIRRFDVYCGNTNRTSYHLFDTLDNGMHTVIIKPDSRWFDKKEIYSSRPSGVKELSYFDEFNTYIGKILVVGEVVR